MPAKQSSTAPITRQNLAFRSAPLEKRIATAPTRQLEAKRHLFCEGDPHTHLFRVEDGLVAIYRLFIDGRRHILRFAYPGDLIGLSTTSLHAFNAQAICTVRVRCFPMRALEREAQSDATLALRFYQGVCRELAATHEQLVTVAQADAIEKVASFLMELHRRNGELDDNVRLEMRRIDIADYLGITIETVSRTLAKLRAMGVVEVRARPSAVRIRDLGRLRNLAIG